MVTSSVGKKGYFVLSFYTLHSTFYIIETRHCDVSILIVQVKSTDFSKNIQEMREKWGDKRQMRRLYK